MNDKGKLLKNKGRIDLVSRVTFVITNNVIDGRRSKDLSEQVVHSIHDSNVARFCGFPHAMVNNISSVVDDVSIGMFTSNSSESVFNCTPWCVAMLLMDNFKKIHNNLFKILLCSLPRNQRDRQGCLELRQHVYNRQG